MGAESMRRTRAADNRAGLVQRHIERGLVDGGLTVKARELMSAGARQASLRAHLSLLRSPLREQTAGVHGESVKAFQKAMGGGEPCTQCTGRESYRHWRFEC